MSSTHDAVKLGSLTRPIGEQYEHEGHVINRTDSAILSRILVDFSHSRSWIRFSNRKIGWFHRGNACYR